MTCDSAAAALIAELRAHANPANVAGMARYGIATDRAFGMPIPILRALAKRAGKDHRLAGELWASGIHEARILATMVEDPARITPAQMDRWDTIRLADGRVYAGERAVVVLHEIDHMDGVLITDFPQGRPHA